jgi:hypothetical protein
MTPLRILIGGVGLMLVMNTTVQAEMRDMSKFTCAQLLNRDPDALEAAVWLSGYYNGQRNNTVLDMDVMKHNIDAAIAACKDDPSKTMMQTVDKLLAIGKKQ